MNVCSNCFTENELKAFINTSTTFGNCDVCESQTVALIDLDELMDFFSELISNFELNESGTPLINKLQVDWNFFSTNDIGNSIINHALEEMESEILSSNIKVGFSSQILENVNYWEKLKEELKWSKRFVTNIDFLTKELAWDRYFGSEFLLNPDVSLYRARLHKDADQNAYKRGVEVEFLGQPSSTAVGPAVLHLRSGAPLLFGITIRRDYGLFDCYIQKIEIPKKGKTDDQLIREITQKHAHLLEEWIYEYPEQWFWMHKRWKVKG